MTVSWLKWIDNPGLWICFFSVILDVQLLILMFCFKMWLLQKEISISSHNTLYITMHSTLISSQ